MNLDQEIENIMNEAFNNASVMDVRELRSLYYGRLNLYASFTDDGEYIYTPEDPQRPTPTGIVCHEVNDVVGKKVGTSYFYANVFRIRKETGFVHDLRSFTKEDLEEARGLVRTVAYIKSEAAEEAIRKSEDVRLRSEFQRFWELTKTAAALSTSSSNMPKLWAKLLLDMGYYGFNDSSGSGVLVKQKVPVCILLDDTKKEDFDIIPIQKFRKDPRSRIRDQVERKVKKMATRRNRVAKHKVTRFDMNKDGVVIDLINMIRGIF